MRLAVPSARGSVCVTPVACAPNQDCNKAIQLFQSYVHQMQKSASAIEQIVEMIRTESIVPLTLEGASGETLDLQACL